MWGSWPGRTDCWRSIDTVGLEAAVSWLHLGLQLAALAPTTEEEEEEEDGDGGTHCVLYKI